MGSKAVAEWFTAHPGLAELLDARGAGDGRAHTVATSDHDGTLVAVEHGYGDHQKPEDYLDAFADFVRANSTSILWPADGCRAIHRR